MSFIDLSGSGNRSQFLLASSLPIYIVTYFSRDRNQRYYMLNLQTSKTNQISLQLSLGLLKSIQRSIMRKHIVQSVRNII